MNNIKKQLNNIPSSSGVYLFKDVKGRIIYIGKAVNLRARVKSYFVAGKWPMVNGLPAQAGKSFENHPKSRMIFEIAKIDYKTTNTEIDALILESQLIKKHHPKYNVMLKDDKNYFYAVITNDEFPKVFVTHQPLKAKSEKRKVKNGQENIILGPYTDGAALKITLKYLRKIFPYCACKTQHKLPCLKSHLGLCLGVCCLKQESKEQMARLRNGQANDKWQEYQKNIKSIIAVLSGRRKNILKKLEKEMKNAVKKENFEKAAEIRNKINALKNIFEHKIIRMGNKLVGSGFFDIRELKRELRKIFRIEIERIEFYDISNIQGDFAVGSMVVFDGEKINKSEYRKFKIKTVLGPNDPAMMAEIISRRLKHKEWQMPNLIIVDGGITQLLATRKVLKNSSIKCVSLSKNPDRLFVSYLKQIPLKDLSQNTALFLRGLRDEAHRFAIAYHRKLRSKKLESDFYIK